MAQSIYFFVNFGIFFDKGVGGSDVGFWLVIIKVANKIVNGVFWKVRSEFGVKLGGEGFVVADD